MKFRFEVKRGQAAAAGQHGQGCAERSESSLMPVPSQGDPQLLGHTLAPQTFPLLVLPGPSAHHPPAPSPRCSPSAARGWFWPQSRRGWPGARGCLRGSLCPGMLAGHPAGHGAVKRPLCAAHSSDCSLGALHGRGCCPPGGFRYS